MKAKFSFAIANASDDTELRTLIRNISMPGSITLAWSREPCFFLAQQAGCIRSETIVCRKVETGKIIGFGGRSLWRVYQDGTEKTVWYLHSLRLLTEERDGTALIRGYRYFASLPNGSDVPYCITTILDDNEYAKMLLQKKRPGMPLYTRIDTLVTYLVPIRTKAKLKATNHTIVACNVETRSSVYTSINEWNRQYEFGLVHTADHQDKLYPNFSNHHLYTSLSSEGEVNGTFGVWDQQPFKQLVVDAYSPLLSIGRHAHNIWAGIQGYPYLPAPGERIKIVYASFLSANKNNINVFKHLLDRAVFDWSGIGHDWMAVGVRAGHPFEKVLLKKSLRHMTSGVYIVHWEHDEFVFPKNGTHLEIALL